MNQLLFRCSIFQNGTGLKVMEKVFLGREEKRRTRGLRSESVYCMFGARQLKKVCLAKSCTAYNWDFHVKRGVAPH